MLLLCLIPEPDRLPSPASGDTNTGMRKSEGPCLGRSVQVKGGAQREACDGREYLTDRP